jgi:hypothetical protein
MTPRTVALVVATVVTLGPGCSPRESPPATPGAAASGAPPATGAPAAASAPAATKAPPHHARQHIPLLAKGPDDPEAIGCKVDADCTLTRRRDGNCCGDLCWASSAYTVSFAARLEEHVRRHCGPLAIQCPVARCAQDPGGRIAICREGRCIFSRQGAK